MNYEWKALILGVAADGGQFYVPINVVLPEEPPVETYSFWIEMAIEELIRTGGNEWQLVVGRPFRKLVSAEELYA